jgi:hypothetical protein
VDGKGRIYVTQARRLSISVFRIDQGTPEQNNEILPGQKGEVPQESRDDSSFGEITEESIEIQGIRSSDEGKPAARWGHKADGSTGGDGRAAGERIRN